MYAITAPGYSSIVTNYKEVEKIKAIYPYAKFAKFTREEDAQLFLKRNSNPHEFANLFNYGNTFDKFFIYAKYRILNDGVYYVLDLTRIGSVRIFAKDAIIEYKGYKTYVKMGNVNISDKSISGHLTAIYNLLEIIGENFDVNIEIPNFSVFYALTAYSKGNSRAVNLTRKMIQERICEVAFTLRNDYKEVIS